MGSSKLPALLQEAVMDYLFVKFIWFVLFAFMLGGCVGWFTCKGNED